MGLAASCSGHCESDPHGRGESREDFFLTSHERLGAKFPREASGPFDLCEELADPTASRLATVSPPPVYERHGDGRYAPYVNEREAVHGARGLRATSGAVPRYLEVVSPNGCCHCEGRYVLHDAARPRLVWGRDSGDRWLYLGSSGRWYIDGGAAEEAGFSSSAGFLRSGLVNVADGAGHHPTPLDIPLFSWERGVDYRWYPDGDVGVSEAKAPANAEVHDVLQSPEMTEETDLNIEFMDSCSDVRHIEEEPVHTAHLACATLVDVRAELEKDDWIVNRFLREEIKATDIVSLPMEMREPEPGSDPGVIAARASRRSYFTMPVPQDNIPTIVSILSGLPEMTRVTAAFALEARETELTLVQWTAMHDVIFGENFRVQDTLSFRPHPELGVEFRRWTEVVWVKDLPVLHEAIRGTLEERILMEGMRSAAAFSRILDSESRRRRSVSGERVADKAPAHADRQQMAAPAPHAAQAKMAFSLAIRKQQEHVAAHA